MSQNTLIEKIKADAAKTVEEIKAQGASEIESIKRAVEAEVAELTTFHGTNLEKKKAQMELVAVSKAKQAGNIAVQTAKREQIDSIFAAVADNLANQGADDYVQFFTSFVSTIVPEGVKAMHVHAPKNRAVETATILKNTGLSGDVITDGGFKAGLVIKAQDGVYDVTLERLMNEKRADLEMIVVNRVGA